MVAIGQKTSSTEIHRRTKGTVYCPPVTSIQGQTSCLLVYHKKTFTCQVVVGETRFEEGSGASKSLAKRNAAMHALKGLFQMNVEMSLKPGSTNKEEIDVSRHPVSILYEYGQKKGLKVEFEDLGHSGPDHFKVFNFRAKVGDLLCDKGSGRSKKDARKEAAAIALQSLGFQVSPGTVFFIYVHFSFISTFPAYVRCISGDSLRMDGTRVNDSHAEVVARRGLIRFFHHHIAILLNGSADEKSIFVQKERQGKIQLRDGVKFHLYVSTAPCGDAAVFVNESTTSHNNASETKAFFGSRHHGLLRTKVEKGEGTIPLDPKDGILTIDGIRNGQRLRTASCSDKIAKWNVLGVQGTLLSVLIEPVYITSVILGKLYDPAHLSRAVSMRVERDNDNSFSNQLPDSFHVNHPQLERGSLVEQGQCREIETKCKTNVLSLNWCVSVDTSVEIFDGCLGTFPNYHLAKPPRISRQALFASLKEVIKSSQNLEHRQILEAQTYGQAKELARDYQKTKEMLYKRLQDLGFGSWELMQKPPEMNFFS
ncbi:PREDICTED: double-stranded RNA-specific editase 1-like [Acropora digitifera]|uniref:double-stranded RNA-specific editase 1-like n=1 Tax=Acropora digitifera TaxID=70779 RepID=UPI00077ADE32|nr:PREDICTED: double-stranded RNA-specific editase 1-like [Acropora digitifera]